MKLIVGLGNPGPQYEKTRHNIGFRIVDRLVKKLHFPDFKYSERFHAFISESSHKLIIAQPQTFMNHSGEAVAALVHFYKLDPAFDILICSDDKDMLFGKIRERKEGSSGGHKGLQSIIKALGTQQFHRLKFGVGHPDQKAPTDAFVLQKFTSDEEKTIPEILGQAVEKIQGWLRP